MHSESGGFKNLKVVHYTEEEEEEEGTETTPAHPVSLFLIFYLLFYILFNVHLPCSLPSRGDPTRLK